MNHGVMEIALTLICYACKAELARESFQRQVQDSIMVDAPLVFAGVLQHQCSSLCFLCGEPAVWFSVTASRRTLCGRHAAGWQDFFDNLKVPGSLDEELWNIIFNIWLIQEKASKEDATKPRDAPQERQAVAG